MNDPYQVLGLSPDAEEAEVRARYLELVKQFSPDREPERFLAVRTAYEATKDPISIAKRLLRPPSDEIANWLDILKTQQSKPPRLSPELLLSLGNRPVEGAGQAPGSG